jgi:predicted TIM-barrel fold metal-dependent hydrolase
MAGQHPDLALPAGIPVLRDLEASLPMLLPETAIAQMDEAGIEKSILYAVLAPIVYASNEYVHDLCTRFPDRFIGFASVNPKDPKAPAVLEAAVRDMGMKGLKLHPPLQDFFPDDEAVFPVYEKAAELNIPVVFHVGTTPFGPLCRLSQANPLLLDEVAVRFPQLRIMLTHLSTLWHNEAFMVVEKNPNVFIDTAAYLYEIPQILTLDLLTRIGPEKVIFGTDYPMPYAGRIHRMKDFVDCIAGLGLPEDMLEGIFHRNLERLLHGRSDVPQVITARDWFRFPQQ